MFDSAVFASITPSGGAGGGFLFIQRSLHLWLLIVTKRIPPIYCLLYQETLSLLCGFESRCSPSEDAPCGTSMWKPLLHQTPEVFLNFLHENQRIILLPVWSFRQNGRFLFMTSFVFHWHTVKPWSTSCTPTLVAMANRNIYLSVARRVLAQLLLWNNVRLPVSCLFMLL